MQFLDGYKGDFLLHRKAIDNLKNLSPTKLEDQAYMSLEFVISLILKWQDEGVLQSEL